MKAISMEDLDISNFGILRDVYYCVDQDCAGAVIEVLFAFDQASLRITADIEEDSICLSVDKAGVSTMVNHALCKPFDELIVSLRSKSLLWMWELTNQQGYRDGLQFEFTDKQQGVASSITVQLLVAASAIQVSILERIA